MRERSPHPRGLGPAVMLVALATVAPAQDPKLETDAAVHQELATLREDYSDLVLRLSELEGVRQLQDDGTEDEEYLYDEDEDGGGLTFRAGDVDGTFLIFGDMGVFYENPETGGSSEFD